MNRSFILGLGCTLILTGCIDNDMQTIKQAVQNIKNKYKNGGGPIEESPSIEELDPYEYDAKYRRDPFQQIKRKETPKLVIPTTKPKSNAPDPTRPKEELEMFALDELSMVGTLVMEDTMWALIMAPPKDSKDKYEVLHRVKEGNYMGKDYGQIMSITTNRIELLENVQDRSGNWQIRQSAITLKVKDK